MKQNTNEEHGIFKVTQNVFFINENGELLLLQHNSGKWLLVGGHLNVAEQWEEGLRREVEEELGITDFSIERILEFDNWEHKGVPHCGVFFLGKIRNSKKIKLSHEHIDYKWIKNEEETKELEFWVPELRARIIKHFKKIPKQ